MNTGFFISLTLLLVAVLVLWLNRRYTLEWRKLNPDAQKAAKEKLGPNGVANPKYDAVIHNTSLVCFWLSLIGILVSVLYHFFG